MTPDRRTGLAISAGLVALSAYGGAIGLASGALALGPTLDQRLPLQSPVLAGAALSMFVALPATALALHATRGDRLVERTALVAGALLIVWIAVELAFIREFSWLQPFYVGVGATYIAVGRRHAEAAP